MIKIPLTQGQITTIDDCDGHLLAYKMSLADWVIRGDGMGR